MKGQILVAKQMFEKEEAIKAMWELICVHCEAWPSEEIGGKLDDITLIKTKHGDYYKEVALSPKLI